MVIYCVYYLYIFNFMRGNILKSLSGINYWDAIPDFDLGYRRVSYIRKIEKALEIGRAHV